MRPAVQPGHRARDRDHRVTRPARTARVVKLVDTPGLGPGAGNGVGVRVPPRALPGPTRPGLWLLRDEFADLCQQRVLEALVLAAGVGDELGLRGVDHVVVGVADRHGVVEFHESLLAERE